MRTRISDVWASAANQENAREWGWVEARRERAGL